MWDLSFNTGAQVTVHNDGNGEKGIPVEKNHEHDLWVPEMIFGHFLTSSNYEVDKSGTAGESKKTLAALLGRPGLA